jgi:hypothetical protein
MFKCSGKIHNLGLNEQQGDGKLIQTDVYLPDYMATQLRQLVGLIFTIMRTLNLTQLP